MVRRVATRRIEGPAVLTSVNLGDGAYNIVEMNGCLIMGPGHNRIETGDGTVAVVGSEGHGEYGKV